MKKHTHERKSGNEGIGMLTGTTVICVKRDGNVAIGEMDRLPSETTPL